MAKPMLDYISEQVVQYVAELPDRTSPEDQPLMMLVTGEELDAAVRLAFERWYDEHVRL